MSSSEDGGITRLRTAVRTRWEELSSSERMVAQYLVSAPPEQVMFASAQELGAASRASSATVVRALRRLGYAGLPALKRDLAAEFTSSIAPEVRLRQRIAHVGRDLTTIWTDVFDEAQERIDQCRRLTTTEDFQRAITVLAQAGEVLSYGVAACELAARQLTLALGRMGRRARFTGETGFALADPLLGLAQGDAVVIFQPGRMLHELNVVVERARSVGAGVVLVTDELAGAFAGRVDAVLIAPHTPTGMTNESLTPLVVADALMVALSALDETSAVEASHQLNVLRERLVPRNHSPRQTEH
ncbi:transcriptional regulator, RpiR family [Lentzea albidocapillata subsp. violacea]|uniref:Transcriptional regulator, RpiR family n=1 Tax=Lentzea albidocapillata subsp. violacea TaxID=128104 RepID=A0A1G8ZR50_9PSEU|nr:MurR/RpiR family transcriptional regulator [Lentzea albidocapillata]SDK17579.1 transcriptional regulator, RpiR family [Lentzea albidocapillata subsp. violacea]